MYVWLCECVPLCALRLEAEVEQARQKEREKMMNELQQVKQALDSEKASYSTQMEEMELELVREKVGEGGGKEAVSDLVRE